MIVTEIVNGKSNILVSKQGYIDVPSWSPDNTHIAYYYGPPDAIIKDGYSLMLIEDAAIGQKEIQIAPPSLWTKLSPSRTIPPQWSPDGTTILFEGRYDEEIPFAIRYLVGEKGENLRKSVAGFWGKDSKSLFTIKDVNDTILGHQFKLGMIDPSSGEMNLDVFKTSLPKDCFNLIWSDDGEHIVFSTFSNNCYLMETKTGKQRQFYKCDGPCKFYWLSQTSISSNNLRRWVLFFGIFVLSIVLFIIIRFRKWSNILPLKK